MLFVFGEERGDFTRIQLTATQPTSQIVDWLEILARNSNEVPQFFSKAQPFLVIVFFENRRLSASNSESLFEKERKRRHMHAAPVPSHCYSAFRYCCYAAASLLSEYISWYLWHGMRCQRLLVTWAFVRNLW